MPRALLACSLVVVLSACQMTPETQELLSRNQRLESELGEARSDITALQNEKQALEQDVEELSRMVSVLEAEKSSRTAQAGDLRRQARAFVQQQMDDLRAFLARGELLDYVGDELIARNWVDDEADLLVDLDNPVPRNGSLTGVAAYLSEVTPFQVKVLRPIEDELVVIWESDLLRPEQTGPMRRQFPVAVGVERGDLLAYYFPETTGVSFDEGTGNMRYVDRELRLGDSISRSSLDGAGEERAYSLGVYGMLSLE